MPGTIVCGYDGTDGSRAALTEALWLAGQIGGTVLGVFSYKKVSVGGESRDLDEEVAGRAREVLAEAAEMARAAGVPFEEAFVEGGPADTLTQIADERDARFIVVGSYGERPLRGVLLGSTPFKILHMTERPVVVVRAPETD